MSGKITDNLGRSSGLIKAAGGGGKIGQVVSTTKTDTFSTSSTSFTDVTGLSVTITPAATSSKILILCSIQGSGDTLDRTFGYQLVRDSTAIAIGDSDSADRIEATVSGSMAPSDSTHEQKNFSFNYLDSPSSTSATTYKVQGLAQSNSFTVNRSGSDGDAVYQYRTVSTITAMEVLA